MHCAFVQSIRHPRLKAYGAVEMPNLLVLLMKLSDLYSLSQLL